jgi:hypothetical protein
MIPKLINLPERKDSRGRLSFVEGGGNIPFLINQTYIISNRGESDSLIYKSEKSEELIIALFGEVNIVAWNEDESQLFSLEHPYNGLFVPNGYQFKIKDFSSNCSLVVLSSATVKNCNKSG